MIDTLNSTRHYDLQFYCTKFSIENYNKEMIHCNNYWITSERWKPETVNNC